MSTVTADFPAASVRRSHAARFTDGVVAGYVHELVAASRASAYPGAVDIGTVVEAVDVATYVKQSAEIVDTAIEANRSQAPHDAGRPRDSACWNRGGRVARAVRAQRLLEAR
jgi:hypothetical protein